MELGFISHALGRGLQRCDRIPELELSPLGGPSAFVGTTWIREAEETVKTHVAQGHSSGTKSCSLQ